MKKFSSLVWGLAFIIVGIILGLNSFGITKINIFFDGWWTLFIIIPALIGFVTEEDKMGNIVWLVIGVMLLLVSNNIVPWAIMSKIAIPAIVCLIGISIIASGEAKKDITNKINELRKDSKNDDECAAVFSGENRKVKDHEFKGSNITAVFGGYELDLREAKIKSDVVIEATAVFGGIEIKVPENVNVEVKSVGVFGGTSKKETHIEKEGTHTIYVNSVAVFGGVEVK